MVTIDDISGKLNAAMLLIDSEHRIQWMNKNAEEWLGITKTGERRFCYRTLNFSRGFCKICPTGKTIASGTPAHYEFIIPGKQHPRKFEVLAIPLSSDSGRSPVSILEIVLDVTKRGVLRIKEDEMMAQIEKMVAVGQLAAGVAHELNTPLGTISIIADELTLVLNKLDGKDKSSETVQEFLDDMRMEITRCKTIIKDLLDFSKRGVSFFRDTDINALVSKTVDFIKKGNSRNHIRISKSLDPELPMVMSDPDRLRQVLFNVIKNAIEAVDEREDGQIDIFTRAEACFVQISIKDNGSGIRKEHMKRIFEPFFTTKPVGKGTGLGLSVSYGIMKDLHGEIRIESKIGKGTTATLIVPIIFQEKSGGVMSC